MKPISLEKSLNIRIAVVVSQPHSQEHDSTFKNKYIIP